MNNIEELTSKARIELIKSMFEIAKSYSSDQLTVPMPDLEALIAQLEAAQKLNPLSVNVSELEATYIGDIRLHMAAISNWKLRAETAEAALSAANERLSKPVVLPPRRSASSFVDEEFSNKDLAAIYNAARVEFSVKITNAGFTVEGG
ncbi:Uncharacterised protein [Yersinia frederiksenii]|nr:Uncharacterised protein [Yersinia frederiksenii]